MNIKRDEFCIFFFYFLVFIEQLEEDNLRKDYIFLSKK